MATNDLSFSKVNNHYEASFETSGENVVVQLTKKGNGAVVVYANLQNLPPITVMNTGSDSSKYHIFEIDMPAGVEITVKSMDEVISAKISG